MKLPSRGRGQASLAGAALLLLAAANPVETKDGPRCGRFSVLTYNVAGLPQGISQSQPLFFMTKISPRLNGFDIVLAQEDFQYERQLRSAALHPYYSPRSRAGVYGDGLSRFSVFPMSEVEHIPWCACYGTLGHANDCLTPKGFSLAVHELAPGVTIHVYNLHMDAGGSRGDIAARDRGMEQLIAFMAERSGGEAVIVGGDWNLGDEPEDQECLEKILRREGLTDSCRALGCGEERIDRILFRSSARLSLIPLQYRVELERFSTRWGWPLSDHDAVSVVFAWEHHP
jgi:endonuclease/exonuclease/phosphatase family metal-dependent hydrolase